MDSLSDFALTYQKLSDDELLQVASEKGLVQEALIPLRVEMQRRGLNEAQVEERRTENKKFEQQEMDKKASRTTSYRGIGFMFYGRHYLTESDNEKNIQVRTKWFVFSYFPVFPIASYRFQCARRSKFQWVSRQNFVSKLPLQWNQITETWIKALGSLLVIYWLWRWLR